MNHFFSTVFSMSLLIMLTVNFMTLRVLRSYTRKQNVRYANSNVVKARVERRGMIILVNILYKLCHPNHVKPHSKEFHMTNDAQHNWGFQAAMSLAFLFAWLPSVIVNAYSLKHADKLKDLQWQFDPLVRKDVEKK